MALLQAPAAQRRLRIPRSQRQYQRRDHRRRAARLPRALELHRPAVVSSSSAATTACAACRSPTSAEPRVDRSSARRPARGPAGRACACRRTTARRTRGSSMRCSASSPTQSPARAGAVPARGRRARRRADAGRRHPSERGGTAACSTIWPSSSRFLRTTERRFRNREYQRMNDTDVLDKIWLKNYPPGVPAEINPDEYRRCCSLLEQSIERLRDSALLHQHGPHATYARLRRARRAIRRRACSRSQAASTGDRIAIMLPNVLQYPIAIFGALRAGLTVVNTNPLYTARELEHQLADSGASAIVILENFAHTLAAGASSDVGVEHVIVTGVGDLLGFPKSHARELRRAPRAQAGAGMEPAGRDALQRGAAAGALREPRAGRRSGREDIAFLQYTGGTTGVAKGAMLTHRNMVANVLQAEAWIDAGARRRGSLIDHHGAAAVPHLRADRELLVFMQARRAQRADRQSARLSRRSSTSCAATASRSSAASTRCSTRCCNTPGFERARLQRAAHHPRRRHGGAARGRRALEAGHRQRR